MKGSGSNASKTKPLPNLATAKRQLQCKYYIMRCGFFQVISDNSAVVLFLKGICVMIIRQLKEPQYTSFHRQLIKNARTEPLDASYTVDMTVDGAEYAVKIQPESGNRIAVLQAFKIERDEYGVDFELITRNNLLSALLEILIDQGVR